MIALSSYTCISCKPFVVKMSKTTPLLAVFAFKLSEGWMTKLYIFKGVRVNLSHFSQNIRGGFKLQLLSLPVVAFCPRVAVSLCYIFFPVEKDHTLGRYNGYIVVGNDHCLFCQLVGIYVIYPVHCFPNCSIAFPPCSNL